MAVIKKNDTHSQLAVVSLMKSSQNVSVNTRPQTAMGFRAVKCTSSKFHFRRMFSTST